MAHKTKITPKKTVAKSYNLNKVDKDWWEQEMELEAKGEQDTSQWERDQETPDWSMKLDMDDWALM